jgi:hypothetical protein
MTLRYNIAVIGLVPLALSSGPNRVGTYPLLTWGRVQIRYQTFNVPNTGRWAKPRNPAIPSAVYNRQNPLQFTMIVDSNCPMQAEAMRCGICCPQSLTGCLVRKFSIVQSWGPLQCWSFRSFVRVQTTGGCRGDARWTRCFVGLPASDAETEYKWPSVRHVSHGRVHNVSAWFNITKFEQHPKSNFVFKCVDSTPFQAREWHFVWFISTTHHLYFRQCPFSDTHYM